MTAPPSRYRSATDMFARRFYAGPASLTATQQGDVHGVGAVHVRPQLNIGALAEIVDAGQKGPDFDPFDVAPFDPVLNGLVDNRTG
ncbi:MAG TPA: hypothetical protein VK662_13535, partial [Acidothermaceae bacterium]|nr:hypothetical protein [Acidothermaceae bacterium]